jgi:hypothetical protein
MIVRAIAVGFMLLLIGFSDNSEAARGASIEIVGDIEAMKAVRGYAPRKLWLGVTVEIGDTELDFKVKRVRKEFSKTYMLSAYDMARAMDEGATWYAALWERKVKDCGCQYCEKNGYHMEGRVVRDVN